MADNEDGFLVQGESLGRIGRVTREVETNRGIAPPEQRRKRGLRSILEGVFTENLLACSDPNVPTTAKFQIKTLVKADNSWSNEDSPSIIPVLNRTASSWTAGENATVEELYPNKYFVRAVGKVELCHGVILAQCNPNCSTYRVQRVHRFLRPECDGGSGSGSGTGG